MAGRGQVIPTDVGDIVVDGLAIYQIVDLYNYWQRLITPSDQHVTLAKLVTAPAGTPESSLIFDVQSPGNAVALVVQFEQSTDFGLEKISPGISSINIAGHSLGGHLAMAFTRLFPEAGASAYTVNAAGFGTQSSVDNLFNALAQKQTSFDSSVIVNIFGGAGAEFVTQDGLLEQYGQRVSMFIESAEKGTFGHGVGQLTDSAAVFDLFVRMDPALRALPLQDAVDRVASILRGADTDPDMSIESVVGALARLFDVDGLIGSGLEDDRQAIYSRVNAVREASSGGTYSVVSLTDQDASTLEALSYGDIAYRYALKELNPFAILGADYDVHNDDGALDVYDEETGAGALTHEWLSDRAGMLEALLVKQTLDTNRPVAVGSESGVVDYIDRVSGERVRVAAQGTPTQDLIGQRQAVFGGVDVYRWNKGDGEDYVIDFAGDGLGGRTNWQITRNLRYFILTNHRVGAVDQPMV